ncbi:MAG: hypothetical protein ILP02_00480, partial [Clostridia bacterium]|nr:hypothetical protein [Clostridia bacterium]
MTGFDTIKFVVDKTEDGISSASIGVFCGAAKLQLKSFSDFGNGIYGVTVGEKFDISKAYTLKADGYGEKTIVPTGIFDTAEFAEMYHYDGNDLGAVISGDRTVFKLWAPTASKVVVNFFFKGEGGSAYKSVNASPTDKGVWTYAERCGHGTYYTYTVTTACGTQELVDPYAKAVGVNGDRGMVVDLGITDPRGWKKESFVKNIKTYSDAVIWEVHVRDFSIGIRSSKYRGKYLAFTERGLTNESGVAVGVDHLVSLGVTHVHLNPVYDFATVDEKDPSSGYNWGYDPKNYNAPEGSYSTDPFSGAVRVTELKTAVAALHKAGIGVVIDVVYNHTYESNSFLNKAVPYYYYRFDERGNFTNGSGCGNETASERYMFRKFILDSVTYWLTEYKLDGVRFDLMGLHDLKTMERIEKAVHKINPYALIYGEGWTGGPSALEDGMRASLSNVYKLPASFGASGAVA